MLGRVGQLGHLGRLGLSLGGKRIVDTGATNLLTFAQAFDNAAWVKTSVTVAANNVLAPDGNLTADTLTTTGAGVAQLEQDFVSVVSTVYTVSVYFPAGGTAPFAYIQINQGGGAAGAQFITINRSTGALSAAQTLVAGVTITGLATPVGSGWLLAVTFTAVNAASKAVFAPCDATANRTVSSGITLPVWQGQAVVGASAGPLVYR